MPPSSRKSIVRASRCNRTNEGSSCVPKYGPSRGAYADHRGSRRDRDSQPMLIHRELRRGALIAMEREEGSLEWARTLAVAAACFLAEGPFEVRCANQSCKVRERVGMPDRSM